MFLTFLLLTTLLPASFPLPATGALAHGATISIPLGGKGGYAAVVHPKTHRSIIPNLAVKMRGHVQQCMLDTVGLTKPTASILAAVEEVVQGSLKKLRVIRVNPRYKDWALAFRKLRYPSNSLTVNEEDDEEEGLDLVVCDGFADGYWPERSIEEERIAAARIAGGAATAKKRLGIRGAEDVGVRDIFEGIGKLRKELGTVVVLSLQGIWV